MAVDQDLFQGRAVYNAVGCDACGKTGFKGRGAIFEVLQVTDPIESMIIGRRPTGEIKAKAIEEDMTTLRDDGWNRVFSGFTTIDEVLRVTEDQAD